MTPAARVASAAAGLNAVIAVSISFSLTRAQHGGNLLDTLWQLARYFTYWTNTTVALVMLASALAPASALAGPRVRLVTVACIALVGSVYFTLLSGSLGQMHGAQWLAEILLHAVSPLLCILAFVLGAHGTITWRDVRWGLLPPAVYGPYVLIRGLLTGSYPYWFLDLPSIGLGEFALFSVLLVLGFLVYTAVFIAIDKALSFRRSPPEKR